MKSGLAQDTAKSAKNLAQQIAKQMAREPVEILKDAKEQAIGEESFGQPDSQQFDDLDHQKKLLERQNEIQDKVKSSRRMEALDRELIDIRKQDLFKDLQRRISEGEDIPLEDYSELSMEEKQVLKAQMEVVKVQRQQAEYAQSQEGFRIPGSKRGRKMGSGQKQEAEKQQTRVEKPVPPSG